MSDLREISATRQVPGEPRRRWFCSPELDLIVWLSEGDSPIGFQLCYDKLLDERALTWRAGRGFDHSAVDNGEGMPTKYKGTPILVADGAFNNGRVSEIFREASSSVPAPIRSFVADALARYPHE
jgi:hypothetical protein